MASQSKQIDFHYLDIGTGFPVVFQHGLGGDIAQVLQLMGPVEDFRLICLECVNHGNTGTSLEPHKLSLESFVADLGGFLDQLELPKFILGGMSMGAALALAAYPKVSERVAGLIILRPAWLNTKPDHLQPFVEIADFLDGYGPWEGRELFQRSRAFRELSELEPMCAQRVLAHFSAENPDEKAAVFRGIAGSAAPFEEANLAMISAPALILASRHDPLHPYDLASSLSQKIANADLEEIPSRYRDEAAYLSVFRDHFARFVNGCK